MTSASMDLVRVTPRREPAFRPTLLDLKRREELGAALADSPPAAVLLPWVEWLLRREDEDDDGSGVLPEEEEAAWLLEEAFGGSVSIRSAAAARRLLPAPPDRVLLGALRVRGVGEVEGNGRSSSSLMSLHSSSSSSVRELVRSETGTATPLALTDPSMAALP